MRNKILNLCFFGIAMGYLESAVVYYLREIYCPSGFFFPFPMPPLKLFLVELGREVATIVMLITMSFLIGKGIEILSCFCILFGLWDIFYYVFLYVFLKWPSSLFAWDILFSIPVTWASPMICPILVSVVLIVFGVMILKIRDKGEKVIILNREKILLTISLLFIFISFTLDAFINPKIYLSVKPQYFHWELFYIGMILFVVVLYNIYKENRGPGSDSHSEKEIYKGS